MLFSGSRAIPAGALSSGEASAEHHSSPSTSRKGSALRRSNATLSLSTLPDGEEPEEEENVANQNKKKSSSSTRKSASSTPARRKTLGATITTAVSRARTKKQALSALATYSHTTPPPPVPSSVVFRRRPAYDIKSHWGRADSTGTRWLAKVPEDAAPKRLYDIPVEPKRNEVVFTRWEPFAGRTLPGYTLFTSEGYRYWADAGAVRWLNAAEGEGITPATHSFVVRHTKTNGLSSFMYGFRAVRDEISDDEATPATGSDDDDMAPGVSTPPLDDVDVVD